MDDDAENSVRKLRKLSLFAAVEEGREDLVVQLLEEGDRDNHFQLVNEIEEGMSVLHHATLRSETNPGILDCLLRRPEIKVNVEAKGNITPLHVAAYTGDRRAVRLLLALRSTRIVGLDARSCHRLTALHMAAKFGDAEIVRQLLTAYESASLIPLLNADDKLGWTALHHAAWEGHEAVVNELLCCEAVSVNARDKDGFSPLHLAAWNNHLGVVNRLLTHDEIDPIVKGRGLHRLIRDERDKIPARLAEQEDFPFQNLRRKRRTLAGFVEEGFRDSEIDYKHFLRKFIIDVDLFYRERSLWGPGSRYLVDLLSRENDCITPLHCAAFAGHLAIVKRFVRGTPKKFKTLNCTDNRLLTPLHYATVAGHSTIVKALIGSPLVRVNLEDGVYQRTAFQIAFEKGCGMGSAIKSVSGNFYDVSRYEEIELVLSKHGDVKSYVEGLYRDRQVYVDATNAILVGAGLIASITFAGWLQPPLGYSTYYETQYLISGAAPPGTYEAFASIQQHLSIKLFWTFNSLSFFFAIATVIAGAGTVLPIGGVFIREEVKQMRSSFVSISLLLCWSIIFVLGAFVTAGFASLPPTLKDQWPMVWTSAVGVYQCLVLLYWFTIRLFRLSGISKIISDLLGPLGFLGQVIFESN